MTHTLDIPEWGIHIRTDQKIFIVIGTKKIQDDSISNNDYYIMGALSLANTPEEAIDKVPREDLAILDYYEAFDILSLISEEFTLFSVRSFIDEKLGRE